MAKPLGLYVHFPFCRSKCAYCDFPSFPGQEVLREPYARAVCAEIRARGAELGRPAADTAFLGGGTPSLMEPGQIRSVLIALREAFALAPDAEITIEANPGTLTPGFLAALRDGGANRLSLGAQSAKADELRLLGRAHRWEDVTASVRLAREAGFFNLNLDLMCGLPGQDWAGLKDTLEQALALNPAHLSCYSLILEEGTPLAERVNQGSLGMPGEEEERELYWNAVRFLEAEGYPQYEISNFARPGFRCRHNLNCWNYEEYLGFGAAAAGFYGGARRRNPPGIAAYLAGALPEEEAVTRADAAFERVMLGLRLKDGLDLEAFRQAQGREVREAFPEAVSQNLAWGLMEEKDGRLRLTARGYNVMDRALLDFLP